MAERRTKVLIVGAGPAGYTAAIYAARAGLKPLLVAGMQPGGQMTITTEVENFPGFSKPVQGPWLMEEMREQALAMGTEIVDDVVVSCDLSSNPKRCAGDSGDEYVGDAVILATGARARWLGVPGEDELKGFGVSACATCDGPFYRGKTVGVVGGGSTALTEALHLAHLADRVLLIHRREALRGERVLQERVLSHPRIRFLPNRRVVQVLGDRTDGGVTGILLADVSGRSPDEALIVDGLFVAIGHDPVSGPFAGQVDTDPDGYVLTAPRGTATSAEGVFAAGDLVDRVFRQACVAAGSGCMAALEAERWLDARR